MPQIHTRLIEHRLSDGSLVYDVQIANEDRVCIRLPAISERDAYALMAKIEDAITEHTNEMVVGHFESGVA